MGAVLGAEDRAFGGALDAPGGVDEPLYELPAPAPRARGGFLYRYTFPYPGRKPWNVVRRYIEHFAPDPQALVCDPYAGGGTSVGEGLRLGRRVFGADVQPVAELVNRALITPVTPAALAAGVAAFRAQLRPTLGAIRAGTADPASGVVASALGGYDVSFLGRPLPATLQRPGAGTYADAFAPDHLVGLLAAREAVVAEPAPAVRNLLLLAFANMLRYANRSYEAKVHKKTGAPERWRGNTHLLSYGRLGSFERATHIPFADVVDHCLERIEKFVREREATIGDSARPGETAWFVRGDARDLRRHVDDVLGGEPFDYVIADPPYGELVPYADVMSFWNVWLPGGELGTDRALDRLTATGGRPAFTGGLVDSVRAVSASLKPGGWFTLFYLELTDFQLWQQILDGAADAGLEHVNSNWTPQQIPSRTQLKNPLSGIRGAVAANFRRVTGTARRAAPRPTPAVRPIETPLAYLRYAVERVIVQQLGATTTELLNELTESLFTQHAVGAIATQDKRSFVDLLEDIGAGSLLRRLGDRSGDEAAPAEAAPAGANDVWVLREDAQLDPQLDPYDRLRYRLFRRLAATGEASLSDLAREAFATLDEYRYSEHAMTAALATFADPVNVGGAGRGGWRMDWRRRTEDAQLSLLLSNSTALALRAALAARAARTQPPVPVAPPDRVAEPATAWAVGRAPARDVAPAALQTAIDTSGLAALAEAASDKLRSRGGREVARALNLLLRALRDRAGEVVDEVWAVQETARGQWDPEDPRYDELPLLVVLRDGTEFPPEAEEALLIDVFGRIYDETAVLFVPYFRRADAPDVVPLFGPPEQRVRLLGQSAGAGAAPRPPGGASSDEPSGQLRLVA